jgi:multiple sugar transport system permease protein
MLSTSMKPAAEVFRHPPAWLPERPAPGNYAAVWSYVPLGRYFLNSIVVAGGATLLNLAMALPAAYALARLRFAGRAVLLHVVLASQMVSPVVLLLSLFRVFKGMNLLDTYASLILPNAAFSLAFSIWLLTGYFAAIPREMEEAALIDGCGRLGALRRVLMPISRPGLVATVIFTFIHAWNEFVFALTFISRREMLPLTTGIYMGFIGRYEIQWHLLMAASLFAIVPVLALFIAIERHLVGGLTAGGIR